LSETSKIYWQSQEKSGCHLKRTGNLIETLPLEKAPEAYARMMDGKARFRLVLVNGKG
jgi:D-arabinose 1-dehydrogenase-like Zn-dependent alcohol dehydrogenase